MSDTAFLYIMVTIAKLIFKIVSIPFVLYINHIILFDSLLLGGAVGGVLYGIAHVHPALAIVAGVAVLALVMFLQSTKYGLWIVGGIMSLLPGLLIGSEIFLVDKIWGVTIGAAIVVGNMLLHLRARSVRDGGI